jgi:hypothetical protein
MPLVSMQHLFTLSRSSASPPNAGFALSLPILVMAWALVGVAIATTGRLRGPWTRILLVCATFTALTIVLMTHAGLILALPRYYSTLQYSYRLESYALLALSGAVLSVLVLAQGESRRLRAWTRWALPPALVVATVGAAQQAAAYPSTANRDSAVAYWSQPPTPSEAASTVASPSEARSSGALSADGVLNEYIDMNQPLLKGSNRHQPLLENLELNAPIQRGSFERLAYVHFDTATAPGLRLSATVDLPPGELVNSNLFGSPSFVDVTGARIVGINSQNGADVLEVSRTSASSPSQDAPAATATISVAPANSVAAALGRVLTVCALIALILQFGLLAIRRYKEA